MSPCIEIERCRPLLGTLVKVRVEVGTGAGERQQAFLAINAAFAAIERVQRTMSAHSDTSDLARLAREGHKRPVEVDPWTYRVLKQSCELARESHGAVNPAIGGRLVELGFLPPLAGAPEPDPDTSFEDLAFRHGSISTRRPLRLDLGGLAKGFAVDRAVEVLKGAGIAQGVVDAGGDLRVFGPAPLAVGIPHPGAPERIALALELSEGAIATSGTYQRRRRYQGRLISHLIRPWDGEPQLTVESISVLAATAFEADALTKILLFRRLRAREHFTRRQATGIRIDRRGHIAYVGAGEEEVA